jgi:PhnB protein
MKVNAYLNFGGNCAEAFQYYEQHLGGKIAAMFPHGQVPGVPVSPELAGTIMHARLDLGDTYIMACDVEPGRREPMRSAYLCLSVDSDDEAERIYAALSDGAEVFMPIQETFFATRFAQLRDRFGISWMVIHDKPMGPPA